MVEDQMLSLQSATHTPAHSATSVQHGLEVQARATKHIKEMLSRLERKNVKLMGTWRSLKLIKRETLTFKIGTDK